MAEAQPSINEIQAAAERTSAEAVRLADVGRHAVAVLDALAMGSSADAVRQAVKAALTGTVEVAVVGEFKTGKTTLVNGLLGDRIVPNHVLARLAVPVVVRYGPERSDDAVVLDATNRRLARVPLDRSELEDLCAQDRPEINGSRVDHLRISLPHPLLKLGVRLVDTPGLSGGRASRSAGRVLQQMHEAHAVILVTDASQELTATELDLLREAERHAAVSLVVMTRIDLYGSWSRVRARNVDHVKQLQRPPMILGVGAGLQRLARRLDAPDIERESGFPLLWWYLGLKVLAAARFHAVAVGANVIRRELRRALELCEGRVAALGSEDERKRLVAELDVMSEDLSELGKVWQVRLRVRKREAATALRRDLDQRGKQLQGRVRLQISQAESVEEWPAIEGAVLGGVNALFADHLLELDRVVEQLVDGVAADLHIDRDALAEVGTDGVDDANLSSYIDAPETDQSAERLQRSMLIMRTSAIGGTVGITAAGYVATMTSLTALLTMVPVVGLAVGAGGLIGIRFFDRMQRGQQTDRWRSRAHQEVDRHLNDALTEIRRHTIDILEALHERLDLMVPSLMEQVLAEKMAERKRLQALVAQRRENQDPQEAAHVEMAERIKTIDAHAERLRARLDRPDMGVYTS
ncbi:MAG: dynamin family protein [Actinomycetota bacterium]